MCVYVCVYKMLKYYQLFTMTILKAGILNLGNLNLQGPHLCLHLCTFGHLCSQMGAPDMINHGNYTFKGNGEGDIK